MHRTLILALAPALALAQPAKLSLKQAVEIGLLFGTAAGTKRRAEIARTRHRQDSKSGNGNRGLREQQALVEAAHPAMQRDDGRPFAIGRTFDRPKPSFDDGWFDLRAAHVGFHSGRLRPAHYQCSGWRCDRLPRMMSVAADALRRCQNDQLSREL